MIVRPTLPFRFLDLPPEIRNQIYEIWLADRMYIHIELGKIEVPSFMRVNRQIFQECLALHLGNPFWLVDLSKITIDSWVKALDADCLCRYMRHELSHGLYADDPWSQVPRLAYFYPSLTFHTGEKPNRITINFMYTRSEQNGKVLGHALGRGASYSGPPELLSWQWLSEKFTRYEHYHDWAPCWIGKLRSDIINDMVSRRGSVTV